MSDNEHENENEAAPINPQAAVMVEAIKRSGMRLQNAEPRIKREYAAQMNKVADHVEQVGGITEGAASALYLVFALLDLNSAEDTDNFIGEETRDDVPSFIRVCRGIARRLEEMAAYDEAQGK